MSIFLMGTKKFLRKAGRKRSLKFEEEGIHCGHATRSSVRALPPRGSRIFLCQAGYSDIHVAYGDRKKFTLPSPPPSLRIHPSNDRMMGKTRTGKAAVVCTAVAFVLVVIAFTTPNWLETDGKLDNPQFVKIGLWQVCFQGFQDPRHLYDTRFYGCWWVFEEEYYIIHDILLPDFFVATQFFFTLCLTLLLIGSFLTILYTCCSRHHDKYQLLLWATGGNLILAGVCGVISVIIFGARGDGRDWMPNWEHNDISWSFALAVVGSVVLIAAGILFLIEGRRHRKKQERILNEEQKTHTTI